MRLHSLCSFGVSWAHYFNDIQYSTVYYTFTVRESPAESTVGRKTTPTPLQGERSRRGSSQDGVAGSRIYSPHRASPRPVSCWRLTGWTCTKWPLLTAGLVLRDWSSFPQASPGAYLRYFFLTSRSNRKQLERRGGGGHKPCAGGVGGVQQCEVCLSRGKPRGAPDLKASPPKGPPGPPTPSLKDDRGLSRFPPQRAGLGLLCSAQPGHLRLSYLKSFDFAQDVVL